MSVIQNPLLGDGKRRGLIPEIKPLGVERPSDQQQLRTWESLTSVVSALFAWLKLWEWHDEIIPMGVDTTFPHGLGRVPVAFIPVSPVSLPSTVVSGDINRWTSRVIILSSDRETVRLRFVLF